MTHSVVAAIEARDQRIAQLERRLEQRENTVSLMADELAFMATTVVRLREENASLRPAPISPTVLAASAALAARWDRAYR